MFEFIFRFLVVIGLMLKRLLMSKNEMYIYLYECVNEDIKKIRDEDKEKYYMFLKSDKQTVNFFTIILSSCYVVLLIILKQGLSNNYNTELFGTIVYILIMIIILFNSLCNNLKIELLEKIIKTDSKN